MPSRLHRRRALVTLLGATGAIVCGALAQQVPAASRALAGPDRSLIGSELPRHVSGRVLSHSPRVTSRWTGVEVRKGATAVAVRVSPSYVDAEEAARRWADFMLRLIHGGELDGVTLYLATAGEVAGICGIDAAGCYGSEESDIVAVGDASSGVRPEAIVAHEYGHFIAANRDNAPWKALDWGPKRWASALNVCAGVRAKKLFPGDQLWKYMLNPGEAFAESYRYLNNEPVGGGQLDWPIVHKRFLPDARALAAVRRDVVDPWTEPTLIRIQGRIGPRGRARVVVATPLDGELELRVQGATVGGSHAAFRMVCGGRRTAVVLSGNPGSRFILNAWRP